MTDLVTRFTQCLDFRQTAEYARITKSLGWEVAGEPGSFIYFKRLGPVKIAKIQRPTLLDLTKLNKLRKKEHILWSFIEPKENTKFVGELPKHPWYVEPYAHSTTALVDLKLTKEKLFNNLDTATRTKIRRAQKELTFTTIPLSKVKARKIERFLNLGTAWSKEKNIIGYESTYLQKILTAFKKDAYFVSAFHGSALVCQLLLIKQGQLATAFCIFTTPLGYRLRAPLATNWQAILSAKKLGVAIFDFFGIFDPRYPRMYRRWQGFSAAKMLFKPTIISFPRSFLLLGW